jgi:DNA-binding winged helix-turn-helix (wHTH) protein
LLYRFDDFLLDPGRRELWRGASAVELPPRVFDLLTYLIQNREGVVSQDDLLAGVWKGRIVSESTMRSHINAVRAAIGDNGEDQRLIRTLPRKGFRFVGSITETDALISPTAGDITATLPEPPAGESVPPPPVRSGPPVLQEPALPVVETIAKPPATKRSEKPTFLEPALLEPALPVPQHQNAPITDLRGELAGPRRFAVRAKAAAVGVGLAAVVSFGAIIAFYWRPAAAPAPAPAASRVEDPRQQFDAAVIPLMSDSDRQALATYPTLPGFKALAIAAQGWGVASGASNPESAKSEALQRCSARAKSTMCKIYASGMDVTWSRDWVPMALAADLHTEPLDEPLRAADLPLTDSSRARVEQFARQADHKALALTGRRSFFAHAGSANRAEAVRLVLERCGERYQAPCIVVSVDGMLTMRIPKSRRIVGTFLLTSAADMTDDDRLRIAEIYRQKEWRALVRGKNGRWYAVANAPSEEAAVDAALQSCASTDTQCRLHAIGNFLMAGSGEEPVP